MVVSAALCGAEQQLQSERGLRLRRVPAPPSRVQLVPTFAQHCEERCGGGDIAALRADSSLMTAVRTSDARSSALMYWSSHFVSQFCQHVWLASTKSFIELWAHSLASYSRHVWRLFTADIRVIAN